MTHIHSQLKKIASCTHSEMRTFYALLTHCFLGVSWEQFVKDFQEKDEVILLRKEHAKGEIVGFSTIMVLSLTLPDEDVIGIFSGDTVVLPEYRSSTGLGVQLGSCFMRIWQKFPDMNIYYILMSKGWRTYKILPFFFLHFSPCSDRPLSTREKAVMDVFGQMKYPDQYHPETGIITFQGDAARLRPESVDVFPTKLDKYTRYYLQRNPGYLKGNELVCVARVRPDNFTPALKRLLGTAQLVEKS